MLQVFPQSGLLAKRYVYIYNNLLCLCVYPSELLLGVSPRSGLFVCVCRVCPSELLLGVSPRSGLFVCVCPSELLLGVSPRSGLHEYCTLCVYYICMRVTCLLPPRGVTREEVTNSFCDYICNFLRKKA